MLCVFVSSMFVVFSFCSRGEGEEKGSVYEIINCLLFDELC